MPIQIFGYVMPELTAIQWIQFMLVLAVWFYMFLNYLVRKRYIKVAYLDDGESFDVFDCKVEGNQVEFIPEKVKKLYGVVPIQRASTREPVRKDISAGARNWIRGPRTFKLYFCSYNSPCTIDPTKQEMESLGLSLGHEAIKSSLAEVAIQARETSRRDYVMFLLLVIAGMFLDRVLLAFFPQLRI